LWGEELVLDAGRDYLSVLSAYPLKCQPLTADYLGGAGGFSGARIWRIRSARGLLCLRRWPQQHPPRHHLEFIQALLWHVDREGVDIVPVPIESNLRAGYVEHAGFFWELTPWMPGEADYREHPSATRLQAAMKARGRFHRAAATFPLAETDPVRSPSIERRAGHIQNLKGDGIRRLGDSIDPDDSSEIASRARQILSLFPRAVDRVESRLADVADLCVPLRPCIRDVWHRHVLFEGDEVSGLIDFGATRVETVATDVSRLLGSLAGDDPQSWQQGLDAYNEIFRLSDAEARLVEVLDMSSVLLSGITWIEWIFVEHRLFEDIDAVCDRLEENLVRLGHLVAG